MSKQGFKELVVWQKSKALAVAIYRLTSEGKISRDFGLIDPMRRSAVSVPSNIAEGDERDTDKDSIRCFYISKGSLAELITQLEIAKEIGYVNSADAELVSQQCIEVGKMLGGLIKARSRFSVNVGLVVFGILIGVSSTFLL
jgi:four helix bundle protein